MFQMISRGREARGRVSVALVAYRHVVFRLTDGNAAAGSMTFARNLFDLWRWFSESVGLVDVSSVGSAKWQCY